MLHCCLANGPLQSQAELATELAAPLASAPQHPHQTGTRERFCLACLSRRTVPPSSCCGCVMQQLAGCMQRSIQAHLLANIGHSELLWPVAGIPD